MIALSIYNTFFFCQRITLEQNLNEINNCTIGSFCANIYVPFNYLNKDNFRWIYIALFSPIHMHLSSVSICYSLEKKKEEIVFYLTLLCISDTIIIYINISKLLHNNIKTFLLCSSSNQNYCLFHCHYYFIVTLMQH